MDARPADPSPIRPLPEPSSEPESVKWLALVLAEMFRVGLSLIAKRYPEARGKTACQKCGWRG